MAEKEYIERRAALLSITNDGCTASNVGALMRVPAADVVEVVHGEWEIVKGSNGQEKMVCTNCRHQQDLHSTFTYCPNCGAEMDGKGDA